ncbi:MAG: diaminopimelate decarboxylase, partial [Thermodesulfobacteriota bacterium]|nr:diaminopimelate decarboxylase [Thermodesulfobacteriota bacterium]
MNDFEYRDKRLYCGEVLLDDIADREGTPFYCYSMPTIRRHVRIFEEGLEGIDHQTCFAMKANSSMAILAYMASQGIGADVVSGGELFRALKAGIRPGNIVYSGVGKTTKEIDMALDAEIMMFNCESASELETINHRAGILGKKAP